MADWDSEKGPEQLRNWIEGRPARGLFHVTRQDAVDFTGLTPNQVHHFLQDLEDAGLLSQVADHKYRITPDNGPSEN